MSGLSLCFRTLGAPEQLEWQEFGELMDTVSEGENIMSSALEKSGLFSTFSHYKALAFPGTINTRMVEMWKAILPLKIRTFLWKVIYDRIQ